VCVSVLGLQAELFYVREGIINEYAIKFVVPVPAQIHKLHFTWENLVGRPVSQSLTRNLFLSKFKQANRVRLNRAIIKQYVKLKI